MPKQITAGGAPALEREGIEINALTECPFYSARKIDNVKVGPSPDWLRAKIEAAGIRSINNIVDISNFVMLELGQPTHAFDADKLKGGIVVRLAREGEKFLALDGKTYSLKSQDLVIGDQERVVGIGGVMGGEETGVTESTKNVLLEAAYFLPSSVRRTARTLNLPSDASYRFERGVDPEMILPASNRAAELMREIASGTPAKEIATAGKLPSPPEDVSLRYEKCDQLLGLTLKHKEVDEILERFGLSKKAKAEKAGSTWKIPVTGAICNAMSILSRKSFARTALGKWLGPTEAVSREQAQPMFLTISKWSCGKTRRARPERSAHFETDSAVSDRGIFRSGLQRKRDRAAQSVERRSRRAAAKFDRRLARSARTKRPGRGGNRRHL